MNYTVIRRLLLKIFIGFLSITALVAIVSVLGRSFGETQFKVLATTFAISAGSICGMACAGLIEKKGTKAAGVPGILAAAAAVLLVVIGVWGEIEKIQYWKTTVTFIVISVALAHACLVHLPSLAAGYRWTQAVAAILVGLLAVQIIMAVLGEIKDEGFYRLMAAISVLVVLMTLVVPICSRLAGRGSETYPEDDTPAGLRIGHSEELILHRVSGAIFADRAGRRYQVTEIFAESDPAPGAGDPGTPPAATS